MGAARLSLKDWIKGRIAAMDVVVRPWAERSRLNAFAYEFLLFGLKQAWACIFGGAMLALILGTHLFWPRHAPIARYDFIVVGAVAIQAGLLATRLERWYEALVILIFHVVGTAMEMFKTAHGSWIYPEPSLLQDRRRAAVLGLHVRFDRQLHARAIGGCSRSASSTYPPRWTPWLLAILAYANFFTHHYHAGHPLGSVRLLGADLLANLVRVHARQGAAADAR